jgi:cytochrome c oxidase accessory protein FixG
MSKPVEPRQGIPIILLPTPMNDDEKNFDLKNTTNNLYVSEKKIYPRTVHGFFSQLRWLTVILTQCIFYVLPWMEWGSRQAVLFDLNARKFYLFAIVFYPQDFIYLTGLLIVCALSLFLFTSVAGRLWCGYACPQTVYSEIFLWIERVIEGDRSARLRLDKENLSIKKFLRKLTKHTIWIVLAIFTGLTFVAYFTPIHFLINELTILQLGSWEIFWIGFYALATYGNAGFLREQVCLYMCPYARFQSAMFDADTLIVTYDEKRGENRGARSRQVDSRSQGLGDCIDCTLCVQVCPTGIDIRSGLQYQCIGCGACADVCNKVMDKMGYARGLIRYATQNSIIKGLRGGGAGFRLFRPRIMIYSTILILLMCFIGVSLFFRQPVKLDIVRDRVSFSRLTAHGTLENIYRIHLMNATEKTQSYQISVHGVEKVYIHSEKMITVPALEAIWIPVQVAIPSNLAVPGIYKIYFDLTSATGQLILSEPSVFIVSK